MVKIYYPNSGSAESLYKYQKVDLVKAKEMVVQAFKDSRMVIDIGQNKRLASADEIKVDSVLRVFPMVGGG